MQAFSFLDNFTLRVPYILRSAAGFQQYTDGSGSMANETEKTANSVEGIFNALKNDWTAFVGEFAILIYLNEIVNPCRETRKVQRVDGNCLVVR